MYAIKWFEEAIEYLDSDINAVDQAVRGSRYVIKVMTTNPWHGANSYIKYLNIKFPFNKELLIKYGYQWKIFGKELFHYANYRINPTITAHDIKVLEDMKLQDENEWKIISIGLPGVPKGGEYSNLIQHISRLVQPGDVYSCGIDFGFMHDPMAVVLTRSQNKIWSTVDVLAELYFNNRARYTWSNLAYRICRWFWAQEQIREGLSKGLNVYCDKSNPTFIEMLNEEAKRQLLTWLKFFAVHQIEILFRISFKQRLIGVNRLNIALTTNYLLQELATASWDIKSIKPRLLRDIPDHAMDAFDYAMVPWYRHFIQSINPHWFTHNGLSNMRRRRFLNA